MICKKLSTIPAHHEDNQKPLDGFCFVKGLRLCFGERCTPSFLLWERWLSAAKLDEMDAATGKPSNMVMHCEARKSPASACLSLLTLGLPFPQFSFSSARCPASSRTISKNAARASPSHFSANFVYVSTAFASLSIAYRYSPVSVVSASSRAISVTPPRNSTSAAIACKSTCCSAELTVLSHISVKRFKCRRSSPRMSSMPLRTSSSFASSSARS